MLGVVVFFCEREFVPGGEGYAVSRNEEKNAEIMPENADECDYMQLSKNMRRNADRVIFPRREKICGRFGTNMRGKCREMRLCRNMREKLRTV